MPQKAACIIQQDGGISKELVRNKGKKIKVKSKIIIAMIVIRSLCSHDTRGSGEEREEIPSLRAKESEVSWFPVPQKGKPSSA
jgi:hypothetical protein